MTTTEILDDVQSAYNKYEILPQTPYNVAKYLMDNNDYIWRLLKYDKADAWNDVINPNLTKAQKGALIYNGVNAPESYRVFFTCSQDFAWTSVATVLRLAPVEVIPKDYVTGIMSVKFEVYTHTNTSMLSNYEPRNLRLMQQIIKTLNGAEVEGIGRLWFNARASSRCRLNSVNVGSDTFSGMELIMCNNAIG